MSHRYPPLPEQQDDKREIIVFDVVKFSKYPDDEQVAICGHMSDCGRGMIAALQHLAVLNRESERYDQIYDVYVPTGDGFFMILKPRYMGQGLAVARNFMQEMKFSRERCPACDIRASLHVGTPRFFHDINGQLNAIGRDVIYAHRIMDVSHRHVDENLVTTEASPSFIAVSQEAYASCYSNLRDPRRDLQVFSGTISLEAKHGLQVNFRIMERAYFIYANIFG